MLQAHSFRGVEVAAGGMSWIGDLHGTSRSAQPARWAPCSERVLSKETDQLSSFFRCLTCGQNWRSLKSSQVCLFWCRGFPSFLVCCIDILHSHAHGQAGQLQTSCLSVAEHAQHVRDGPLAIGQRHTNRIAGPDWHLIPFFNTSYDFRQCFSVYLSMRQTAHSQLPHVLAENSVLWRGTWPTVGGCQDPPVTTGVPRLGF